VNLDPAISTAIFLGILTAIWTILIYIYSQKRSWTGELKVPARLACWGLSILASGICLLFILQVPDWALIWIRWQRHDYCALPGHAGLYWIFVRKAPFAFAAPVFAFIALRLAGTPTRKVVSLLLFIATLVVLALTLHGLYWSTFYISVHGQPFQGRRFLRSAMIFEIATCSPFL
jgi:hypothetical protein